MASAALSSPGSKYHFDPISYVARRDAARAWLAARGRTPYRHQADAAEALPKWYVPGWTTPFDDADLMRLAASMGWEGGSSPSGMEPRQ